MIGPTRRSRGLKTLDAITLAGAALVVLVHVYAGIWEMGHPALRPVGHATILVAFAWVVATLFAATALIFNRGRSPAAFVTIAVTVTSAALLFSV